MFVSEYKKLCPLFLLLASLVLGGCSEEAADESEGRLAPLLEGMGNFQHDITTGSELAQRFFNQGMVLSYGFNHKEAERSFREAARLDSNCAMAYWGIALVLGPNINAAMEDEAAQPAYEALQKALALADKAGEKEQAYIHALSKRYTPQATPERGPLDEAYAAAMRDLAHSYPDDADAVALFAESLMDLHPWNYWESDGTARPWTAEILTTLENGLQKWPNHPGLNHFYIHAVEASKNPERGLISAETLGDVVPGAGHLVHMPAHIYIRTGRYQEAVFANERAIAADSSYLTQCHAQGIYPLAYVPHNHHFLVASATFAGVSEKALAAARHMAMQQDAQMMRQPGYGTLQHFATMPLYALIKFGKWDEILQEPEPEADLLYPRGIWHFARGMAYTRTNQIDLAEQEFEKVKTIAADSGLLQVTIWDINSTYDLMQIAREVLAGELAARRGQYEAAITNMQNAIHAEDNLNYDEPPPWLTPVRHNLGAILLEANRAGEAEEIYRQDLAIYPNNGWSLYGLHQSLLEQGKTKEAELVYKQFQQAWEQADVKLVASRL